MQSSRSVGTKSAPTFCTFWEFISNFESECTRLIINRMLHNLNFEQFLFIIPYLVPSSRFRPLAISLAVVLHLALFSANRTIWVTGCPAATRTPSIHVCRRQPFRLLPSVMQNIMSRSIAPRVRSNGGSSQETSIVFNSIIPCSTLNRDLK